MSATDPSPREPGEDFQRQAEMTAGSVLLYSGTVLHSGGRNESDVSRLGLNITYCLGWLRQVVAHDFPSVRLKYAV